MLGERGKVEILTLRSSFSLGNAAVGLFTRHMRLKMGYWPREVDRSGLVEALAHADVLCSVRRGCEDGHPTADSERIALDTGRCGLMVAAVLAGGCNAQCNHPLLKPARLSLRRPVQLECTQSVDKKCC